ncbi:glutathione S-transferase [Xylaria scruposa]|nr:glutathione S-transferase [Xylaria scruposa]
MSKLQPLVVYSSGPAPNPWKVAFVLEELGLPWKFEPIQMPDLKKEPYTNLNPNGRVPTLVDPNKDQMTVWESGAIVDYLIEEYDKDAKLHYTTPKEKSNARSWQYFQVSGQGPYFGQLGWFTNHHSEKLPSAIERYTNEVKRVIGVIDGHLAKTGTDYLVGDKVSYADLMFIPYFKSVGKGPLTLMAKDVDTSQWVHYTAWMKRLHERPAVAKIAKIYDDIWVKILAEQH